MIGRWDFFCITDYVVTADVGERIVTVGSWEDTEKKRGACNTWALSLTPVVNYVVNYAVNPFQKTIYAQL